MTRLRLLGTGGWLFTGFAAACAVAGFVLLVLRPVILPVAVAVTVATIGAPVVGAAAARRIPRAVSAALCCLLVIGVAVAVVAVFVSTLADQWDKIAASLTRGTDRLGALAAPSESAAAAAPAVLKWLVSGMASGTLALVQAVLGSVLCLYALFFLLKDGGQVLRALPVDDEIAARAAVLVRRYFLGMTGIGLVNAVLVGIGAAVLSVPYVGAIALVTFLLAYVPYVGAFSSGAFAVLLALGAGGTGTAVWMLVVVLLANGTLQNLLEPFAFGAALRMHPLLVLLVTVLAGVVCGVVGVIAAPLVTALAIEAARNASGAPADEP